MDEDGENEQYPYVNSQKRNFDRHGNLYFVTVYQRPSLPIDTLLQDGKQAKTLQKSGPWPEQIRAYEHYYNLRFLDFD